MKNIYSWFAIILVTFLMLPQLSFAEKTMEYTMSVALPVELTEIKTYTDNEIGIITLEWKTASEVNSLAFEVERSTSPDGGFEEVGRVDGSGNSTESISYNFNDENVISGIIYYYRLKQIDIDGRFEYSGIVSDEIKVSTKSDLLIYPNPVVMDMTIDFNREITSTGQFRLMNLEGKTLFSDELIINEGKGEVDVSELPRGMYFIEIRYGNEIETIKFIINR